MIVLALSSGTSVDAVDAAAAELRLDADGTLRLGLLGQAEYGWPAELHDRIQAAMPPAPVGAGEVAALDTLIGRRLGEIARAADIELAGGVTDVVASHGQTLFHWVGPDGTALSSLQIGHPAWIAEASGRPVVSDFRVADIAAGGQGAPLAALLDAWWLAEPGRSSVALNIGGIANVTVVCGPGEPVTAWDTGPGNCLLDAAVRELTAGRLTYDRDGALAAAGTVDLVALDLLRADPYYARRPPRSSGREHFDAGYVRRTLAGARPGLAGPDLLATLVELTARTVADDVRPHAPSRVVVSGGGAHHPVLMRRLAELLPGVTTSDALGLPVDAKEAYLFALLGFLAVAGLPGTAPGPDGRRATGARRAAVLGSLTPPAPHPLRADDVRADAVRRLVLHHPDRPTRSRP
ncbi:anhydro-N-acetylmuramic acid kinase [Cellulomonas hominis]